MRIVATQDAKKVVINGHGIRVDTRHELMPGIFATPPSVGIIAEELEKRTMSHLEYAAILSMGGQATFAIEVNESAGGEKLAAKGWNALWLFGLMSMACRFPCLSMFAYSDGSNAPYSVVARNVIVIPSGSMRVMTADEGAWIRRYTANYEALISNERFSHAMRAHTNAHYLFDMDQQLMLIWAGIEGLLSVDSELRRRIALYAAILLDDSHEEKIARFHRVKKAYDFRSRIVQGSGYDRDRLAAEQHAASELLLALLAKCVVLGRVPTLAELDEAAASVSLT